MNLEKFETQIDIIISFLQGYGASCHSKKTNIAINALYDVVDEYEKLHNSDNCINADNLIYHAQNLLNGVFDNEWDLKKYIR